ncbi:hypothetical protein EU527_10920 [Candidatus Thorarchaeota archaeon]|nr:MAG: hypothetical protein EU527_10920 [Candidatus Thorarchaeota archaeon]
MNRRAKSTVIMFLFLTIGLTIFIPQVQAQETPLFKVGVSIAPLAGMVKAVGGVYVETFVILPEGTEPHAAQLPTQAILDAQEADLLVLTGHFPWEEDLVLQVAVDFITMDNESALASYHDFGARYSPMPGEEHVELHSSAQEHEHVGNPHGWWLLPENAIAIANATRVAFSILNSTYSSYWETSFQQFVDDINAFQDLVISLDETYHFSTMKAVVIFPAEAYIAEAFGIEAVAYLQEGSVQISSNQLLEVQAALRNGSVHLILGSDVAKLQSAGEFAEQLIEDYGGTLIWLRAVSFSGLSDYISVMTYNLGALISGLEFGIVAPSYSEMILILLAATSILAVIVIIETILLIQRARAE